MTTKCANCNHDPSPPARASFWYMHDNHTFEQLKGSIDEKCERARELGIVSPGMLCGVILLDDNEKELRRVGKSQHASFGWDGAQRGFTDAQITEWRASVLADADVVRLLALTTKAVQP